MPFLYLDIETVPAQSAEAHERIAARVKPPSAMKKADTIAAWERDQKPEAVKDAIAKTSFDGGLGHICCIGYALDDEGVRSINITSVEQEADMIRSFFAEAVDKIGLRFPVIVGHYITGFDLRFIWQRCMALEIPVPAWVPKDPKPWDAGVFDTMTRWAGQRETISLDNLCAALGIPGKQDVDGSMVGQMFADGLHDEIAAYCRRDVATVRAVHRKMRIAYGEAA